MKPDGERIATMEQKMTDLNEKVDDIATDVKEIKEMLYRRYVPRKEYEEEISKLQRSGNFWKWVSPSLAAILGSILTFLLISFINNV